MPSELRLKRTQRTSSPKGSAKLDSTGKDGKTSGFDPVSWSGHAIFKPRACVHYVPLLEAGRLSRSFLCTHMAITRM